MVALEDQLRYQKDLSEWRRPEFPGENGEKFVDHPRSTTDDTPDTPLKHIGMIMECLLFNILYITVLNVLNLLNISWYLNIDDFMMVYNFYNHDMFKKIIPSYHDPHQHRTKDTSESSACLRKRRLEMTIQSGESHLETWDLEPMMEPMMPLPFWEIPY